MAKLLRAEYIEKSFEEAVGKGEDAVGKGEGAGERPGAEEDGSEGEYWKGAAKEKQECTAVRVRVRGRGSL